MYRTHTCGELRIENVGQKVTLAGWVQRSRKLGGMTFIDLRDRYGITQLVLEADADAALVETATSLGREYVIQATGEVVERQSRNARMDTGDIEIKLEAINILNKSVTPPFTIEDESDGGEDLRAKFRYLDLRRNPLQKALALRHKLAHEVRNYLDGQGFMEIETPYLIKSTPEGARDFVVPSRMNQGQFYALPQSPQTFKQLLMVAGYDRYFQIVRCFRDEDLRADRQPEFTQIDLEMSFADEEDIIAVNEGFIKRIFDEFMHMPLEIPFARMTWHEAMERYGSDKPDTRFALELINITDAVRDSSFAVFKNAVAEGGSVRAINVPGGASFSRKEIDSLVEYVKTYGARGLAWYKHAADAVSSSFAKFLTEDELKAITDITGTGEGDLLLIVAAKNKVVFDSLGALRCEVARRMGLIDKTKFNFLWITEFPLFEYSEEDGRYYAMHHPFTMPMEEDYSRIDSDPGSVRARAYDIVLNGTELGGGSIRIHTTEMQKHMFKVLGIGEEEAAEKFGFLLEAFRYGVPPHGGLAFGLDRLVALLLGLEDIRDVIAFPKVQNASELLSKCPAKTDEKSLEELGIKVIDEEE